MVHKGPLVSLANDNFILKAVIQGNAPHVCVCVCFSPESVRAASCQALWVINEFKKQADEFTHVVLKLHLRHEQFIHQPATQLYIYSINKLW